MNWLIMLLAAIFVPVVQPVVQNGVHHVQARVTQRMQQPTPPAQAPHVVFHNGEWWKYEQGQWWVWRENTQQWPSSSSTP